MSLTFCSPSFAKRVIMKKQPQYPSEFTYFTDSHGLVLSSSLALRAERNGAGGPGLLEAVICSSLSTHIIFSLIKIVKRKRFHCLRLQY